MKRTKVYLMVLVFFGVQIARAQSRAEAWADSVLDLLSNKEKLAQLLLVETERSDSSRQFLRYGVGGLLGASGTSEVSLWRADSLQFSSPDCSEERLLLSTTDTSLLQQQGRWHAAAYLQNGTHLLYTNRLSCVQTSWQQRAFAHYLKGLEAGGLRIIAGPLPTADNLQLNAELPLARGRTYRASFDLLRRRLGRDFSRRKLKEACKRVLLDKYRYVVTKRVVPEPPTHGWQRWQRVGAALTLLRNRDQTLPLQGLDTLQLAALAITTVPQAPLFFQRLLDYFEMPLYLSSADQRAPKIASLASYDYLIVSLHVTQGGLAALSPAQRGLLDSLQRKVNIIWVHFGAPSVLNDLPLLAYGRALLLAHEDSAAAQDLAAQALFGGIGLQGQLTAATSSYAAGTALHTKPNGSLSFVPPETFNIPADTLFRRVSKIVEEALQIKAFPGCRVLFAKNGRIFFDESYGYHSYEQQEPVTKETIYDLASLTKVMAPTTALMRLYSEGRFLPDARLSDYLSKWADTDKGYLDFRSMLAHQAGLQDWIPYYKTALQQDGTPDPHYFSRHPSSQYPIQLTKNLYLRYDFKQQINKQIAASRLSERDYSYSGLLFYLLPEIIELLSGRDYEEYLRTEFYAPMGAKTLTFRPDRYFPLKRFAPTEQDTFLRMQLLRGVVHDEGCAMMGGISGNSGLFGKAIDIAKLWQMYLQGGYYGGRRYLQPEALAAFTACQFCDENNRRGMGFDRPPIDYEAGNSSVAPQTSEQSFGHTGFTGTIAWADAAHDLLFVFLSNRVHPSRFNRKIYIRNIRPRIHQVVYELLGIPANLAKK